ncbi:MAG: hypothetical protein AAF581_00385 [Planctomycetota bacterium]
MVELMSLWLPILLSAVFVFVASSIIHMALPIHKSDFSKLPGESDLLASMRGQGLQPGSYMFPCAASMKDMASPEMVEKFNQGPVGYMTVVPSGPYAVGKSLVQWFIFSIVVGVVVAYVASLALTPEATKLTIFRFTASIALMAYGLSNVTDSIWKGVRWSTTWKFLFDGVVYGAATGAAFVWFWPSSA